MKKMQPVSNYLLILPDEGEKQTSSGIYIPETAKEKPQFGKIVAAGPGIMNEIAIGDTVVYKKYAGTQVEWQGKDYLLIPDAEVLAKIVDVEEI